MSLVLDRKIEHTLARENPFVKIKSMPKPLPPKPLDAKTARLRAVRFAIKPPPRSRPERLLALETEFTFGKHKDLTVAKVLEIEPSYLIWLSENVTDIVFADDIEKALQEIDDPRKPPKAWESPRY